MDGKYIKIVHVVGARPNYMKVAPILTAMARSPEEFEQVLVHTGQHYDFHMSEIFFEDLGLRNPDHYPGVETGTHAEQTARVMLAMEPVLENVQPDLGLVVGDVNSTLASALVCSKLGLTVGHVETGLRSYDRDMPEEVKRVLTDQLSEVLFTPSRDADDNLIREGISPERIHFVGNVMIDSLIRFLPHAAERASRKELGLQDRDYALVTLHRPSNVDSEVLEQLLQSLRQISRQLAVVFAVHPRTMARIKEFGFEQLLEGEQEIILSEPLGYLDFLSLMVNARIVLTDSGGIQEETTYLGIPCLTARPNTEKPVTLELGTNRLVPSLSGEILAAVEDILNKTDSTHTIPELWDGQTADRIDQVIRETY